MMLLFFINITKHLSERISNTFTANSLDDSCFYGNSKRLVKVQEMIKLFKWDNKVDFPLYYSGGKFSKLEILEQSSRNSGADSLLTACWMGSAGSYHWSLSPRQPGALGGTGTGVGKRRTLQLVSLVEKKRDDSTVRNERNIQEEQNRMRHKTTVLTVLTLELTNGVRVTSSQQIKAAKSHRL